MLTMLTTAEGLLGDHEKAIADFKRALELTKESKLHQDAEKQLRDLGAM
jgi:hypothetical protein